MIGSFATKAKDAVDRLREAGHAVGLVRPPCCAPFPEAALRRALAGKRGVAVLDQNLSMGKAACSMPSWPRCSYGQPDAPPILASFIGGLGGRDISPEEFYEIAAVVRRACETGRHAAAAPALHRRRVAREMRKLQALPMPISLPAPARRASHERTVTVYQRMKDIPAEHAARPGTAMCAAAAVAGAPRNSRHPRPRHRWW